jgi:rSAM/selenodomain-associated transferase 1
MIPPLDADEALALHLALVEDSLDLLRRAAAAAGARPYLSFSEPCHPAPRASLAGAIGGMEMLAQRGGDLGERLRRSFTELLGRGHPAVVVIGSDSPTVPAGHLIRALLVLRRGVDAVVGPAEDGGYYLIGTARDLPGLFDGIPWGTGAVCDATFAAARRIGARLEVLPCWHDIDRPEDLRRLRRAAAGGGVAPRTAALADALAGRGRLGG